MLQELRVKNFGIIEEINWRPGRGLNVVTGETGAGKSLVIDAIDTLLSGRSDESDVRHGAAEAYIEATFDISDSSLHAALKQALVENGLLEEGEDCLVISGEIRRQGRSAFRVNGRSVSRGVLRRIGGLLVDIHGQSDHLSLLNRDYHLDFLDGFAHATELRARFAEQAAQLLQAGQELRDINDREKEQTRQEEFLRFQVEELKRAELRDGEEEELDERRTLLASSEKLKEAAYEAYQAIYGDDSSAGPSALEKLGRAAAAIQKLAEIDKNLKSQLDYVREIESGLSEVAYDVRRYRDAIDYDPQQLQEIELRLGLIRDLKRKYGQTIGEMLEYLAGAERQLEAIGNSDERRRQLAAEIKALKQEMGEAAEQLSRRRSEAARKMESAVNAELKELNMSRVRFEVDITRTEDTDGIPLSDGKSYAFDRDGVDRVEFRAATNPGEPFKPLAAIASTGEVSRFMLALKSVLAEADNIPVLVFDEIDIGVGGRSGEVVGRKLWSLAGKRQAVCITHLPQIAVFADAHYTVRKSTAGERTTTTIDSLKGEARLRELAEMLSGPQHTDTALRNAGELAEKAEVWKKTAGG